MSGRHIVRTHITVDDLRSAGACPGGVRDGYGDGDDQ